MACKINNNEDCKGRCCRNCAQVITCSNACNNSDCLPHETDCEHYE